MTCDPLRLLISIAEDHEGCGAQNDRERFAGLVCPEGPESFADYFCRPNVPGDLNSSCGVVGVGFLRAALRALGREELGGALPLDWWSPVVDLAKKHDAYHTGSTLPVLGALVHLALKLGEHTEQHWRTIVKVQGDGLFETIDGGAKDKQGYQLIQRATVTMTGPTQSHQTDRTYGLGAFDVTSKKPVFDWVDSATLLSALAS